MWKQRKVCVSGEDVETILLTNLDQFGKENKKPVLVVT